MSAISNFSKGTQSAIRGSELADSLIDAQNNEDHAKIKAIMIHVLMHSNVVQGAFKQRMERAENFRAAIDYAKTTRSPLRNLQRI